MSDCDCEGDVVCESLCDWEALPVPEGVIDCVSEGVSVAVALRVWV